MRPFVRAQRALIGGIMEDLNRVSAIKLLINNYIDRIIYMCCMIKVAGPKFSLARCRKFFCALHYMAFSGF